MRQDRRRSPFRDPLHGNYKKPPAYCRRRDPCKKLTKPLHDGAAAPICHAYLLELSVVPVLLEGLVVLEGLVLDGVVLLELPLPDESVELEPVEEPLIELPDPDVPDVLLSVPVVPDPDEPVDEP